LTIRKPYSVIALGVVKFSTGLLLLEAAAIDAKKHGYFLLGSKFEGEME